MRGHTHHMLVIERDSVSGLLYGFCETCHDPDENGDGRADVYSSTRDEIIGWFAEHD